MDLFHYHVLYEAITLQVSFMGLDNSEHYEPVLEWNCLVCSRAIDCRSTGYKAALSDVQYSDRLLFYRC